MRSIHSLLASSGFVRDTGDRVIGGVCSGLARKFGVDAWAIRLAFIVALFAIPGSQIIIYPIAWLLMPDETRAAAVRADQTRPAAAMTAAPAGVTLNQGAADLSKH